MNIRDLKYLVALADHGTVIVERARHILNQIEEVREIAKSAIPLSRFDPYPVRLCKV